MPILIPIAMILFFVLFMVGALLISTRIQKARLAKWKTFAEEHELEFLDGTWPSPAIVRGKSNGVTIEITTEVHGSDRNKKVYTRYRAWFSRQLPKGLTVTSEGVMAKLAKVFGGQDIQLGDPAADRLLRIKGNNEDSVRKFLNQPHVLRAVLEFVPQHTQATIKKRHAELLVHGFESNPANMENMLRQVVRVVEAIERTPTPSPRPAPVASSPTPPQEAAAPATTDPIVPSPAPPARPAAAADAPATPPSASLDTLQRLAQVQDDSLARGSLLEELVGSVIEARLVVDHVTWTTRSGVSREMTGGRTVVGKIGETKVAICFPKDRSDALRALSLGATMPIQARVSGWDSLYSRLDLDIV